MTVVLPEHRRMVLWGLTEGKDSFRHIHRHYAHALERLGKPHLWVADAETNRDFLEPGDLVFAVDVDAAELGRPVPGVDYLLHNMDSSHPVFNGLEPERLLRLQVYTNDCLAWGEPWGLARRYDREARTLFQPWGTDLLLEEFLPPTFNKAARNVVFVGSIWDDNGLGNAEAIAELQRVVAGRRLHFRPMTHVTDAENVDAVRVARLAPAIAGQWQCSRNYLPCRVFKNVSYGALGITNVPLFGDLFGGCAVVDDSIEELIGRALSFGEREYLDLVREQQWAVAADFTYLQSLNAIARAFEEGR